MYTRIDSNVNLVNKARERLAFEVIVFSHLHLLRSMNDHKRQQSFRQSLKDYSVALNSGQPVSMTATGELTSAYISNLPFQLTDCQTRVIEEIFTDLASTDIMVRLLQGDVGSGKTVVATTALLRAVEVGL